MLALRELHPAAERNVVRTAQQLRDEAEVLDAVVADVLGGEDRIELARLRELAPALRRLIARRLAEDATGRLVPAAAERVDELLALADHARAELHLEGPTRAVIEHGTLRFEPLERLPGPAGRAVDDGAAGPAALPS